MGSMLEGFGYRNNLFLYQLEHSQKQGNQPLLRLISSDLIFKR